MSQRQRPHEPPIWKISSTEPKRFVTKKHILLWIIAAPFAVICIISGVLFVPAFLVLKHLNKFEYDG